MNKRLIKDGLMWGFGLWFFGYILGIVLFPVVPTSLIGWVIMPIGILITLFVLVKKVSSKSFKEYFLISLSWTLIAVVFDYLFLVQLFKPADGYYKLDVYLYYLITFLMPIGYGFWKRLSHSH